MNVLKPATLRTFWEKHPQSKTPLRTWLKIVRKAQWSNFADVKETFRSTDAARAKDGAPLVIFDIAGNHYRLAAVISFRAQRVYIRKIMTHKEYDKWNNDGRPT